MVTSNSSINIRVRETGGKEATATIENLGRTTNRMAQESASAGRKFAALSAGMGGLVGAYAGAAATIFSLQQAFQVLQSSAAQQTLIEGSRALASQIGQDSRSILTSIKDITKGQLSLAEAAQTTNQALAAGFGEEEISRLITVATKASRALGRDLTEAVQRITRGVIKLEPELLDELAIFTRINPALDAYARENNKSAQTLTQTEKRQAFLNATLKEGEKRFRAIDIATETTQSKLARLAATMTNLGQQIGEALGTVLSPLADFLTGGSKGGNAIAAGLLLLMLILNKGIHLAQGGVQTLQGKVEGLLDKIRDGSVFTKKWQGELARLQNTLSSAGVNKNAISNKGIVNYVEGIRDGTLKLSQFVKAHAGIEAELKKIEARKKPLEGLVNVWKTNTDEAKKFENTVNRLTASSSKFFALYKGEIKKIDTDALQGLGSVIPKEGLSQQGVGVKELLKTGTAQITGKILLDIKQMTTQLEVQQATEQKILSKLGQRGKLTADLAKAETRLEKARDAGNLTEIKRLNQKVALLNEQIELSDKLNGSTRQRASVLEQINKLVGKQTADVQRSLQNAAKAVSQIDLTGARGGDTLKNVASNLVSSKTQNVTKQMALDFQKAMKTVLDDFDSQYQKKLQLAGPTPTPEALAELKKLRAEYDALKKIATETGTAVENTGIKTARSTKIFASFGTAISFIGRGLGLLLNSVFYVFGALAALQLVIEGINAVFGTQIDVLGYVVEKFKEYREAAARAKAASAASFSGENLDNYQTKLKLLGLNQEEINKKIEETGQKIRKTYNENLKQINIQAQVGTRGAEGRRLAALDQAQRQAVARQITVNQILREEEKIRKEILELQIEGADQGDITSKLIDLEAAKATKRQLEELNYELERLTFAADVAKETGFDAAIINELAKDESKLKKTFEGFGIQLGESFIEGIAGVDGSLTKVGGLAFKGVITSGVADANYEAFLKRAREGVVSSEEIAQFGIAFANSSKVAADNIQKWQEQIKGYNEQLKVGSRVNADRLASEIQILEAAQKQERIAIERNSQRQTEIEDLKKYVVLQERLIKGIEDTFGSEIKIASNFDTLGLVNVTSGKKALDAAEARVNQLEGLKKALVEGREAQSALEADELQALKPEEAAKLQLAIEAGAKASVALAGAFFQAEQAVRSMSIEQKRNLEISYANLEVAKAQAAITKAQAAFEAQNVRLSIAGEKRQKVIAIKEEELNLTQAIGELEKARSEFLDKQLDSQKKLLEFQREYNDAVEELARVQQENFANQVKARLERELAALEAFPDLFGEYAIGDKQLEIARAEYEFTIQALEEERKNIDRRYEILIQEAELEKTRAANKVTDIQSQQKIFESTAAAQREIARLRQQDELTKLNEEKIRIQGQQGLLGLQAELIERQYDLEILRIEHDKQQQEIRIALLRREVEAFQGFVLGNKEFIEDLEQFYRQGVKFDIPAGSALENLFDNEALAKDFGLLDTMIKQTYANTIAAANEGVEAARQANRIQSGSLEEQKRALADYTKSLQRQFELQQQIADAQDEATRTRLRSELKAAEIESQIATGKLDTLYVQREAEIAANEGRIQEAEDRYQAEKDSYERIFATFRKIGNDLMGGLRENFADFITDLTTDVADGTKSIKDAFNDMLTEILQGIQRSVTQRMIVDPILNVIGQGLSTILTPTGPTAGSELGPLNTLSGLLGHAAIGGLVPQRFASGGYSGGRDRIPALLEPGEFVIRKPMVDRIGIDNLNRMNAHGATGAPQVNIVNQGTAQEPAQQPQVKFDGEKYVVDIVLRDLNNNGPIRRGLRGQR